MKQESMKTFIHSLPKAELHVHIEGTLEPELMFALAQKNRITLPYETVEDVQKAYHFSSLQSFLDIYYAGAAVLIDESDFFDLTWAYLLKCKEENIVHTEIFFDPQTHTKRGIAFQTVLNGITRALDKARKELGISSSLIMCFLRHLSQEDAFTTLEESLPFKEFILGVGLDSSELGHPPCKFKDVFQKAVEQGYKVVAHAGEEGDSTYIWDAIECLKIERIDHGIRCEEDKKLVEFLIQKQLPLTICPLSNTKLKAIKTMSEHNILRLLHQGILATVNSDDPAYFGGYLNANYEALVEHLNATTEDIKALVRNSFKASFLDEKAKQTYLRLIN